MLAERPPDHTARLRHYDVLIVGAGLSGVAAAYHLRKRSPRKRFAILEARTAIGGTWDLFRYPGVRSDSDMHTLGYGFNPWPSEQSISGGDSIRDYVRDTARKYGIDATIRFGHRVEKLSWSSQDARWTLDVRVEPEGRLETFTCSFLSMCSGYYDYKQSYTPQWPGTENFAGQIVHPQFWPEALDYAGKRVVIIGSGATAVTLAPEMAKTAKVTLLQRSPTYIVARPAVDPIAKWLMARLPGALSGPLVRWKNVLLGMFFFNYARKQPARFKKRLLEFVREHLGADYDIDTHFTPAYNPWDQRLCLVPDGDLFASIRSGAVEVVTDHIERFTERGLLLRSGKELEADIVVSATGLKMQLMGGAQVVVDGKAVDLGSTLSYKGMMYSGVPNLSSAFGYTNASWTLKCELTAQYVCRLLNHMDREGYAYCTPLRDATVREEPALDFSSGYVLRALDVLPKQGERAPWRNHQNYALDMAALRFGKVVDGIMQFTKKDAAGHLTTVVESAEMAAV